MVFYKLLQARTKDHIMQTQKRIKLIGYISTFLSFILSFSILYKETAQPVSSFLFALLAALMIWGTFIIIGWLASILIK